MIRCCCALSRIHIWYLECKHTCIPFCHQPIRFLLLSFWCHCIFKIPEHAPGIFRNSCSWRTILVLDCTSQTHVLWRMLRNPRQYLLEQNQCRDVWIAAIAWSRINESSDTNGSNMCSFQGRLVRHVYVTMPNSFLMRKSALIYWRGLRQRVASLTLDCNDVFAIKAYANDYWRDRRYHCYVSTTLA